MYARLPRYFSFDFRARRSPVACFAENLNKGMGGCTTRSLLSFSRGDVPVDPDASPPLGVRLALQGNAPGAFVVRPESNPSDANICTMKR